MSSVIRLCLFLTFKMYLNNNVKQEVADALSLQLSSLDKDTTSESPMYISLRCIRFTLSYYGIL